MAILDQVKKRNSGHRQEPEISQAEAAQICGLTVAEFARKYVCPHSAFCNRQSCEDRLTPIEAWPVRLLASHLARYGYCLIPPKKCSPGERAAIKAIGDMAD